MILGTSDAILTVKATKGGGLMLTSWLKNRKGRSKQPNGLLPEPEEQRYGQGTGMIFGRSEGYLMFLFMLGLLIGGCMGILMMALCVIAKKGDDGNGEERK